MKPYILHGIIGRVLTSWQAVLAFVFLISLTIGFGWTGLAGETEHDTGGNSDPQSNVIIDSVHANDIQVFENTAFAYGHERQEVYGKLLAIFKDKKASNLEQCAAAYYLGEMHYSQCSETLASNISLALDLTQIPMDHYPIITGNTVADALVKIGSPAIPALIGNLANSDDAEVRKLSLEVLYHIDGDRDIVQLRLQKALKVETNAKKVVRFQSAIKQLEETTFR